MTPYGEKTAPKLTRFFKNTLIFLVDIFFRCGKGTNFYIRPAKLRFDYAVRISAAEVLRKKDANQTTRIFAKNSLNTHFLTFLIIFRPFLPNW